MLFKAAIWGLAVVPIAVVVREMFGVVVPTVIRTVVPMLVQTVLR